MSSVTVSGSVGFSIIFNSSSILNESPNLTSNKEDLAIVNIARILASTIPILSDKDRDLEALMNALRLSVIDTDSDFKKLNTLDVDVDRDSAIVGAILTISVKVKVFTDNSLSLNPSPIDIPSPLKKDNTLDLVVDKFSLIDAITLIISEIERLSIGNNVVLRPSPIDITSFVRKVNTPDFAMESGSFIFMVIFCIASSKVNALTRSITAFNPSPIEIVSVVAKSIRILYVRANESLR